MYDETPDELIIGMLLVVLSLQFRTREEVVGFVLFVRDLLQRHTLAESENRSDPFVVIWS